MTKPTLKQTSLIALMTLVGILVAVGGGMLGARLILEHAKSHPPKPASHAMGAAASPTWLDPLLGKIVALNGTPVPNEPEMNFISPMNVIDNPGNGSSDIYAPDGGGGGGGGGSGLAWVQQNYDDSTTNVISDTAHHIYVPIVGAVTGQEIQLPEPTVSGQMVLIAFADASGRGSHEVGIQSTGGSTEIDSFGNNLVFENVGAACGTYSALLFLSSTNVGGHEYWKIVARTGCDSILDLYANRPFANNLLTGTRFLASDGTTEFVLDGTQPSWRPVIGGTVGVSPKAASSWTLTQSGGGITNTVADSFGAAVFNTNLSTLGGATLPMSSFGVTPGTAYTCIVALKSMGYNAGVSGSSSDGIIISDGTKYLSFMLTTDLAGAVTLVISSRSTAGGSGSTVYSSPWYYAPAAVNWYEIKNDLTNRTYSTSFDGVRWTAFYSESSSTFITSESKTGVGIIGEPLTHISLLESHSLTSP
jgi:hypothetical protein